MTERGSDADRDGIVGNRRQFLRVAGGAGLLGAAGCVQQADGGDGSGGSDDSDGSDGSGGSGGDGSDGAGGDDSDGSGGDGDGSGDAEETDSPADGGVDVDTVSFGVLVPVSGPSAPLGKAQQRGAKLGVEYVNGSDAFDFEIDAVYEDTQTDPAAGRQKAEKVVEEDGVRYVAGALESSVALAVSDYLAGQEAVYTSGAATMELTGPECTANTFRNETNAAQQMAGVADFAAAELGTNWWLHTTDDAYGNSAFEQVKRRIESEGLDVDIVGETKPDFGRENYGPQISRISNSEAEVLILPDTGGDLINFMKQASNAGLKDEVEIVGTALFAQVTRGALGQVAAGTYSSTLYNHKLDTGDNAQFVEAYRSAHDAPPGSFARVGYELVRTAARGIQTAGTADPTRVRETLEGLEMTTVLGETSYRACDHQSVNPVWTGEIVATDDGGTEVELLEKVPGEEAIRPCEETGCNL
jgi:branched-chain amino acid transport system substrate-binding protein